MKTPRIVALFATLLLVAGPVVSGCPGTDEAPSGNDEDVDAGPTEDVDDQEDADVDPPAPAEVNVLPESITFEGIETDQTEEVTVTVQNLGEQDLEVEDIELQIEDDFDHDLEPADEEAWPEFPAVVHGDQALEVDVAYTPHQAGSTTGQITVVSDDEDQPESTIRIETISAYPELEAPERVTFGTVDPGESETIDDLEVRNRGMQALEVDSIEVDADSDDADAFEVTNVEGSNDLPGEPDTLDRHAFWFLEVTFSPDSDDRHLADIVIESNDPAKSEFVIEASGNRPEPCLSTSGNLDFGELDDGQEMTDSITFLNCSQTQDLEISDLELVDDGGGVFELVDPPEEPVVVDPADTYDITVRATMTTGQEVVGLLTFSSDDPDAEHVGLELRARPTD